MPATPTASKVDDDHAYASVLSEEEIMALQLARNDPEVIGTFIGTYCGVLNTSFEVFHDTLAFAATVLGKTSLIEDKTTFSHSNDIYVLPIRKLNRSGEEERIEELKQSKVSGHPEMSESAIEIFAKFGNNSKVIDTTLLASACKGYDAYIGSDKTLDSTMNQATGEPYFWKMLKLIAEKTSEHLIALGKEAMDVKKKSGQGDRLLSTESVGLIKRGEETSIAFAKD